MKEVDLLEILTLIREIQDEANIVTKTLDMFSDDRNWYTRYTQRDGNIDKFNYLDMDPRIMADRGSDSSKKILENAEILFQKLYLNPIRDEMHEAVILKKNDTQQGGRNGDPQ